MAKYHWSSSKWDSTLLNFREELTVEDCIVLKDPHIVIHHKKCQAMLNLIHEGHLGLNKCTLRAKDTVYWPGLNEQLEKLVLNCELCLKYSFSKHKQKWSQSLGRKLQYILGLNVQLISFILRVYLIFW